MKSELLEFLRTRGTLPSMHGARTLFRHCSQHSSGNPMACVHGQPWVTVAAFDAEVGKKSIVVGMYSPFARGHPAVLRHPEIIYHSCDHCDVPVSYIDDVNNVRLTWDSDGIDAVASASDAFLDRIKLMEILSVITEMPAIVA